MHPAFLEGPEIHSEDSTLWAEFQACIDLGIDPDIEFAKPRESRMLITGGTIAHRAIVAMRKYDEAKLNEQKTEQSQRRGRK